MSYKKDGSNVCQFCFLFNRAWYLATLKAYYCLLTNSKKNVQLSKTSRQVDLSLPKLFEIF